MSGTEMAYLVRYRCKECRYYSDSRYDFLSCCPGCGNKGKYSSYTYEEVVGCWREELVYEEKEVGFWFWRRTKEVIATKIVWIEKDAK